MATSKIENADKIESLLQLEITKRQAISASDGLYMSCSYMFIFRFQQSIQ
jgi:hypothetical protein